MGFFSSLYTKEGPGVPKNAPQKKGVARFFEIFMRDSGLLWRAGFLTSLCFFPSIAAIIVGTLGRNYLGIVLISIFVYLLGSTLVGPALCGLHAVVIQCVRDEPGYLMHTFKKAWKNNWRQSLPAGVLTMVLLGTEGFVAMFHLASPEGSNYVMVALVLFSLLVITSCALSAFVQILFIDLSLLGILKNSLLILFGFAKRSLPAALLLMLFYMALFAFAPWPLWALLGLTGLPAYLCLIADMWMWPVMETAFHVSDQQAARREKESE